MEKSKHMTSCDWWNTKCGIEDLYSLAICNSSIEQTK